MIEANINVKLNQFDGPLGLLLHLIQREEVPIRSLEINQITKQYLDYLKKMHNLNFDIAGEYLYMAATLLYIKSQNCVETSEKEKLSREAAEHFQITTKTDLINRLEELERFQRLGSKLWELPRKNEEIFVRPKIDRKKIVNSILAPMDLQSLTNVMIDLLKREKKKYTVIKRDRLSIKEKLQFLKQVLKAGHKSDFFNLIQTQNNLDDKVITFISLLELARLKKIEIFQNESMGNIFVDVIDSLDSFNVETADGFESEDDLNDKALQDQINQEMSTQESEAITAVPPKLPSEEVENVLQ